MIIIDTKTITHGGHTLVVEIVHDERSDAPWENGTMHGPVTLERRPYYGHITKSPGQRVLRTGRADVWLYNVEQAQHLAMNEWGFKSRKEAAAAVEADFQYLRGWLNGDWSYVGVVVTPLSPRGDRLDSFADSLWGIESNAHAHLQEVADDLATQVVRAVNEYNEEMTAC